MDTRSDGEKVVEGMKGVFSRWAAFAEHGEELLRLKKQEADKGHDWVVDQIIISSEEAIKVNATINLLKQYGDDMSSENTFLDAALGVASLLLVLAEERLHGSHAIPPSDIQLIVLIAHGARDPIVRARLALLVDRLVAEN